MHLSRDVALGETMNFTEKLFLKDLRLTAKIVMMFFSGLAILIFLIHGLIVLGFSYPLDYGEGTMLNQSLRMAQGHPLYPTDITTPPYLIANYPPVFILLNGFFIWVFGPSLLIGRLVAFLSTIGTGIMIAFLIRHFHPNQGIFPGLVGASLFLILPYVLQWSAYYRIDTLALFFSVTGLYIAIKNPLENRSILLAVLFFILAAYTRQSFGLAAPVAAAIWVWTKNRTQAIKLVLIYGISGLAIFGIIQFLSQGGFIFHIVEANVNPFNWHTVEHYAREIYRDMSWLIYIFILFLLIGWRFFRSYTFLVPYMLVSTAVAVTIGKVGSNVNYLLEICVGFAILIGVVVSKVWKPISVADDKMPEIDFSMNEIPSPERVEPKIRINIWLNLMIFLLFSLIIVNQLAGLTRKSLFRPITSHRDRIKMGVSYAILERSILEASTQGPILADEFSAILSINRIPLYIQPFAISQLGMANRWDQSGFIQAIQEQSFPMILIHHFPGYPVYLERWTPEMLAAIFENYVAQNIRANSLVFEPKNFENEIYPKNRSCLGSPWQLPTEAHLGMFWYNRQLLMMGAGHSGQVPVYAVADGVLYQFPEWKTSVAIQHDDPFNAGKKLWSFYGDMAPAFDAENAYIVDHLIGLKGVPVRAGDLIGFQGQWLGPSQQTWVHVRFSLLPAEDDGSFPQALLPIDDFYAPLPSLRDQTNLGLDVPISLTKYTGLPQSNIFGTLVFLPYQCDMGEN